MVTMTTWLLFTYKVPNEPSARRVYIWRKLKDLGAILLHDSIWVLPDLPHTREKLQWLTTEVRDMEGGEATLWQAQQVFTGQDVDLQQQFIEQVDASYRDILTTLDQPNADLPALAKRYQQTKQQDYFQSELGKQVRQILLEQREDQA
jgi:hypothetical protein